MADSKESRVVNPIVHTADGKFVGCGNEACYYTGHCKESGRVKSSDDMFVYTGEDTEVRITDESEDNSEIYISVKADVDGAITGFKALSRELREATKAAREMEKAYDDLKRAYFKGDVAEKLAETVVDLSKASVTIDGKKVAKDVYARDLGLTTHRDLSEVPTEELREELSKRSGVKEYVVKHSPGFANLEVGNDVNDWNSITDEEHIEGSARILVIKD